MFDREWNEATAERVAHYTNPPAAKIGVAAFEMNHPEENRRSLGGDCAAAAFLSHCMVHERICILCSPP
jgi:hypothetical protein